MTLSPMCDGAIERKSVVSEALAEDRAVPKNIFFYFLRILEDTMV